jgi:hypothetical protein
MSISAADFGKWLADQEYRYDEMGEEAWLLDVMGNYLAEGVTDDSEGRSLENEQMKEALTLMQHAPRLLRFTLRALELLTLTATKMSPEEKIKAVTVLLEEVAGNCLGQQQWRQVALEVRRRQAEG